MRHTHARLSAGAGRHTGDVTRLRAMPDLDADIRHRLLAVLGRSEAVPSYIPRFGSWTGSRLVLRLGGMVVYRALSTVPYCYRVTVDSHTAKMESMAKESARDGRTKCQIFPDWPGGYTSRRKTYRGLRLVDVDRFSAKRIGDVVECKTTRRRPRHGQRRDRQRAGLELIRHGFRERRGAATIVPPCAATVAANSPSNAISRFQLRRR